MAQITIPKTVTENIARAKAYIKRQEVERALTAIVASLTEYNEAQVMGKARFEAASFYHEAVAEFNRCPQVKKLIETLSRSPKASIVYQVNKEKELVNIFRILLKFLTESQAKNERDRLEKQEDERQAMLTKGQSLIDSGDNAMARAVLRRYAETYGSEPGVYGDIGKRLLQAKMYKEAAEILELSIEKHPKDSKAYADAVTAYLVMREFEKAEVVYMKVIKQFGAHQRTLYNLAKLYAFMNKKEKSFEAARRAYAKDSSLTEAKELMDFLDGNGERPEFLANFR
ncbi:tetratricopeptide repeat protein [Desulfovibrio litoralis]|uniref:Uncharacterized protein n=1 Tax=Desulfovibrio litoralis DSM 11393 TaxID=1121455 RepID=A0A1M7SH71_9BACT|nr:tetratricopeptide repeat protein [Desulfovibrio litoralis]SHN57829.1 hypothetical protein SAMN02745728_00956 [Desulfovibrio litoralis DSM 11393]